MSLVEHAARTQSLFTTDRVWALVAAENAIRGSRGLFPLRTHEHRAMGAVMRKARLNGWIEPTRDFEPTRRPEGHRGPRRVWRSLIY